MISPCFAIFAGLVLRVSQMSQITAVYFDLSNDLWLIQNMYLHFKNRRINSIPAVRQALVLQTISARWCGHGACEGTNPDHFGDLPLSIPLANVSLFMVLVFTSQEFNKQCRCKGPLCIVVAVIYCDRFFGLFAFRCWIMLQRFLGFWSLFHDCKHMSISDGGNGWVDAFHLHLPRL